jgi:hypothetical protein
MDFELFLSLMRVLLAAKSVVDEMPNDNSSIGELSKAIDDYRTMHHRRAEMLLKFLAERT